MSVYCFDLDNTLCLSNPDDYADSTPITERINIVNRLFEDGHTIIIHTARGSLTGLDLWDLTSSQLQNWGVKHHALQLGKPYADFYVDDKAIRDVDFFK